ncbi:MAG: glycosyltransferase family 2 protein [bacterium]|nr:glycosyltransferase family 2 protein [bacterium]
MSKTAVVIIPTYNERENIKRTVAAVLEAFTAVSCWKMSILVVDDTSPDKTYEVVRELHKQHSNVELLLNQQKSGLGGAYLAGMAHAFGKLQADVVFEFDADLSHDPKKIPLFLKSIEGGSEMVLGTRYIPGGSMPKNWGLHRKIMSVGANLLISAVFANFKIRDWTSGYRAITKPVYEAVHPLLHSGLFSGYTFQIGFLYYALRKNFVIDPNIAYHFIDRTAGESKMGSEYLVKPLMFIFRMRLQEIMAMRVFKFLVVGATGAAVQLSSLMLYRFLLPTFDIGFFTTFFVASFLSIESAIIVNFILNNGWTFADRKLEEGKKLLKFLQFNLTSVGSILIQLGLAAIGEATIGLKPLFTVPVINFVVETGLIFAVTGILLGIGWNFFAYNKFIWKKK